MHCDISQLLFVLDHITDLRAPNDPLHLLHILHCRRQILITVLRDQDIIYNTSVSQRHHQFSCKQTFNTDASNVPVLLQHGHVDVRGMDGIAEVRLNDEAAEVDLEYPVVSKVTEP
jgi:hypothetical protein